MKRPFQTILSIEDLVYTAERLGSFFFSLDTMRHFNSRLSRLIRVAESDMKRQNEPREIRVLFITSEKDYKHAWRGHRRYTVRTAWVYPGQMLNEGKDLIQFDTIGEFGAHPTLAKAKAALKSLPLAEWSNPDLFRERKLR